MARKDTVPLVTAAGFVVASLLLLLCATRCGKYVVVLHFTRTDDGPTEIS